MDALLYLTPVPFKRANLTDKTVVVVDVLRCTTSVCAALIAGSKGVIPTAGPGEATDMRAKIGSDMAVLAGERNGAKIEGFQLGNSPSEFTPESVGGKFVVMTTTNGTTAFVEAHNGGVVLSCGLTNISCVAARAAQEKRDMVIVCAGRDGHFSIEDTICGGMLIHILETEHKVQISVNDAGALALLLYRNNQKTMKETIAQGEHARFLMSIGFGRDVETASAVDSMPVLPVLADGRLILDNR
jgi:2-phosphosulfolactate phosphatase